MDFPQPPIMTAGLFLDEVRDMLQGVLLEDDTSQENFFEKKLRLSMEASSKLYYEYYKWQIGEIKKKSFQKHLVTALMQEELGENEILVQDPATLERMNLDKSFVDHVNLKVVKKLHADTNKKKLAKKKYIKRRRQNIGQAISDFEYWIYSTRYKNFHNISDEEWNIEHDYDCENAFKNWRLRRKSNSPMTYTKKLIKAITDAFEEYHNDENSQPLKANIVQYLSNFLWQKKYRFKNSFEFDQLLKSLKSIYALTKNEYDYLYDCINRARNNISSADSIIMKPNHSQLKNMIDTFNRKHAYICPDWKPLKYIYAQVRKEVRTWKPNQEQLQKIHHYRIDSSQKREPIKSETIEQVIRQLWFEKMYSNRDPSIYDTNDKKDRLAFVKARDRVLDKYNLSYEDRLVAEQSIYKRNYYYSTVKRIHEKAINYIYPDQRNLSPQQKSEMEKVKLKYRKIWRAAAAKRHDAKAKAHNDKLRLPVQNIWIYDQKIHVTDKMIYFIAWRIGGRDV